MPKGESNYAHVEVDFGSDGRMLEWTDAEKWGYLSWWKWAVQCRREILLPHQRIIICVSKSTGASHQSVRNALAKGLITPDKPLLVEYETGHVRVCGVRKKHANLKNWHDDEDRDLMGRLAPKPPANAGYEPCRAVPSRAVPCRNVPPKRPQTKTKPAPAPEVSKGQQTQLFWQQLVPWYQANLHRFAEIQDPEEWVSKACTLAIEQIGVQWPDLQEQLLDASAYLKSHSQRYKSARGFYWNQLKRLKPTVTTAKAPLRPEPKAPTEWVRHQDGVYYDAQGKPIEVEETAHD